MKSQELIAQANQKAVEVGYRIFEIFKAITQILDSCKEMLIIEKQFLKAKEAETKEETKKSDTTEAPAA